MIPVPARCRAGEKMNVSGISRKAQCGGTDTRDEQDSSISSTCRARSAAAEVLFFSESEGNAIPTLPPSPIWLESNPSNRAAEISFREICSSGEMKAFQLQAFQSANSSR
jgi:hypothetical protein